MNNEVKATFAMIVLNGKPFIKYNLRSLYPFAHQIIIVEGACRTAASIATTDGHSTDGTLGALKEFKSKEDPENKITIITAVEEGYSDGFWPEKNEMCAAFAKRITGNYLWCIDHDEFYRKEDMTKIMQILYDKMPDIVSFNTLNFWGGIGFITDGFYLTRAKEVPRLFKWQNNYTYKKHRPPTVLDEKGVDSRKKLWIRGKNMEHKGIRLYHYSLLFPKQVYEKVEYYRRPNKNKDIEGGGYNPLIEDWYKNTFETIKRPFHPHNIYDHISWLEKYRGAHPEQIHKMIDDIENGALKIKTRNNSDIEMLLNNQLYNTAVFFLKLIKTIGQNPFGKLIYQIYFIPITIIKDYRKTPERIAKYFKIVLDHLK